MGDIGKETLTIVVHHIFQPSNRTHTSVTSLLTCTSFQPNSLSNPHHIAQSPTTPMHPYIITGAEAFVDDNRVRGWRVVGGKVTMGREGAYWDQLEEGLEKRLINGKMRK